MHYIKALATILVGSLLIICYGLIKTAYEAGQIWARELVEILLMIAAPLLLARLVWCVAQLFRMADEEKMKRKNK